MREKLETYAIGGFVMIRDDNGGICDCERCRAALRSSRVENPVWEQYLIIYDTLREIGFRGDIAVYPYHDLFQRELDPLLPDDLLIVGHGSANALLTRRYELVAPMGDTWLDNLYVPFRVPPTSRMRRLLADRPSFWIGGAYRGTELPWHSIGYFGWEPSATPNTLRYTWGAAAFGEESALSCVALIDAYEKLRELYNVPMLPANWIDLEGQARRQVAHDVQAWAERFREHLSDLEQLDQRRTHGLWRHTNHQVTGHRAKELGRNGSDLRVRLPVHTSFGHGPPTDQAGLGKRETWSSFWSMITVTTQWDLSGIRSGSGGRHSIQRSPQRGKSA